MARVATIAERLDRHSIPEPNSGCLLWTATGTPDGYGGIRVGHRMVGAHRAAWTVAFGAIPDELHVLHKCDVRACINPAHLFLGTNADNVADRERKGRRVAPRGIESGLSKLNEAAVLTIRADRRRQTDIARDHGIGQSHVSAIKRGLVWNHLPCMVAKPGQPIDRGINCNYRSGERHPHAKLSLADARSIRADKRKQIDIAREYGIRQCTVSKIKRGDCWAEAANRLMRAHRPVTPPPLSPGHPGVREAV